MSNTTARSDVRSKLARTESLEQAQCSSRWQMTDNYFASIGYPKGSVHQCTRPASGHRVHQAGGMQWQHSNVKAS